MTHCQFRAVLAALVFFLAECFAGADPPRDAYGDPLPPGAVMRFGSIRMRHAGTVRGVAWLPDGKSVASVGDEAVVVWNAATGAELKRFPREGRDLRCVAVSPDGKLLVDGGVDAKIRVWDFESGRKLRVLTGHAQEVCSVAFSPDGTRLVSGSGDGTVRVWDPAKGSELFRASGHESGVWSLAWSPDGKLIAYASHDALIRLDDAATGKSVRTVDAPSGWPQRIAFSPDGKRLAWVDGGPQLHMVEISDSAKKVENFGGHFENVESLAWSPDGATLAGGSRGGILLWATDVMDREPVSIPRSGRGILALAWSPDGKIIASGEQFATVRLWDVAKREDLLDSRGHGGPIDSVHVAAGGAIVATTAGDDSIRLWDTATGRETKKFPGPDFQPSAPSLFATALSADGRRIARMFPKNVYTITDVRSGLEAVRLDPPFGQIFPFFRFQPEFSPDGKFLAASIDDYIALWDTETGTCLRVLKQKGVSTPFQAVQSFAWSPDGRAILSGQKGRRSHLWNPEDGSVIADIGDEVFGARVVAFSADGRLFAVAREFHGAIAVFEFASAGRVLVLDKLDGDVNALAFSPKANVLASGSDDGIIRFWSTVDGREICRIEPGRGPVRSLAFFPDGERLVSGLADSTALVWPVGDIAPAPGAAPDAGRFPALWEDLLSDDAAKAHVAAGAFGAGGSDAAAFLRGRLAEVPPVTAGTIDLLDRLDSDDVSIRDEAFSLLVAVDAEPEFRKRLAGKLSPEARGRLEELLARTDPLMFPSPAARRRLRAVQTLRAIGGEESRQALSDLAKSAPWARIAREAKTREGK